MCTFLSEFGQGRVVDTGLTSCLKPPTMRTPVQGHREQTAVSARPHPAGQPRSHPACPRRPSLITSQTAAEKQGQGAEPEAAVVARRDVGGTVQVVWASLSLCGEGGHPCTDSGHQHLDNSVRGAENRAGCTSGPRCQARLAHTS